MPSTRRRRLIDRMLVAARSAGEFSLAVLMTAGVTSCGGTTTTIGGDGGSDAPSDTTLDNDSPGFEVAEEAGGGDQSTHDGPVMEAVEVAQEAGDQDVVAVEAPVEASTDH